MSAVLLVALFTTAFAIWTFTTLPTWVAQREANHQGEAQEAFGRLRGDLDSLVAQGEPGPVGTGFDLGPARVPLLQRAGAQGTLRYEDGFAIQAAFTGAVLHLQDGAAIGIPDEPAGGTPITGVHALEAFSLRLQSSGVQGGATGGLGQEARVQVVANDGTAQVTAQLAHTDDASSVGCDSSGLVLRITSPTLTRTVPLLCQVGSAIPEYTLDLLDQPLFVLAMRDLDNDYSLTVTTAAVSATSTGYYAAVWTDSTGRDQAIGAGSPTAYSLSESGGRIVLDPRYQRFPSQRVAFDGGAVVAAQDEGRQVMLSDPGFDLSIDGGIGTLRLTVVDLAGSGSRTGADGATVTLRHDGSTDMLLEATGATVTVTSDYAAAWRQLFADQALLAGASSTVAASGGSGDTATLTLATDGSTVTTWIVRLQVVEATADVA